MPDINTLPTSRPPSMPGSPTLPHQRPRRISITNAEPFRPGPPSPRSPTLTSLQAAATINAGLQRTPSSASPPVRTNIQGLERRRSSLMNNLSLNDPTVPAPGEMQLSSGSNVEGSRIGGRSISLRSADFHHDRQRQPSLGELHQELESEQENQVNRLLHQIRVQQDQLGAIQRQQQQQTGQEPSPASSGQTRFPTPPSTIPTPVSSNITEQSPPRAISGSIFSHGSHPGQFNRPHTLSRQSSARLSNAGTNSRGNSPSLRPVSASLGPLTEDFLLGGTRDECAFYQAETHSLTRENQMLKLRIRELERQVSDMASPASAMTAGGSSGGVTRSAVQNSPLASPPATREAALNG
ncbi:hypothetical protein LTR08_001368 [Meristemomyces frigidus]|nr:hypothetical protein LTR08_001368 [Meristemomyces frigidus]